MLSSTIATQQALDSTEMINYPQLYTNLYCVLYYDYLQSVDPAFFKLTAGGSSSAHGSLRNGYLDRRKESSGNLFHADSESDSAFNSVEWDASVDLSSSAPHIQLPTLHDDETGSQGSSGDSDPPAYGGSTSSASLQLPFERSHRRNASGSYLSGSSSYGQTSSVSLPTTPVLGHKHSSHTLPLIIATNGNAGGQLSTTPNPSPPNSVSSSSLTYSTASSTLSTSQASSAMSGSHLTDANRPGANVYTLPKNITWLLDNFAKRWFVSPLFVGLANLDFLVKSFAPTNILHLEAIHNTLMEIAAIKKTEKILWDVELQLWAKTTDALKAHIEDCISNYFLRYPRNEPKGALSVVILIFTFLTTNDSVKLSAMLKERVEVCFFLFYLVSPIPELPYGARLESVPQVPWFHRFPQKKKKAFSWKLIPPLSLLCRLP